jgi:tRNA(fMet)-specific endonuclease VapC
MKILDTDTCIAILRGQESVIRRRESERALVATTWITAGELFYGAAKSREPDEGRKRAIQFLQTLPVLGLGVVAAVTFGAHKARLETEGRRLADADLLIASIALAHGAVVVTGNARHYDRIDGLTIESWIER